MRRYLILIITLLTVVPLVAQRTTSRDALRYGQMNEQGVWNVGVSMAPVVGVLHPLGDALGGGSVTSTGIMGFGIEGGYFVADNLRVSASFEMVDASWQGLMRSNPYDGYAALSQLRLRVGGHWHMARWDVGGGVTIGTTTLNYIAADTDGGGVNDDRFGSADLRDRHSTLGLFCETGVMVSPFLRLGAFWSPSIAFGGGYSHSVGAKLTIYLPFVNSVVCK